MLEKETLSSRSVDHRSTGEQSALMVMHAADVSNACMRSSDGHKTCNRSPPLHLLDFATSHSLSAKRFQVPSIQDSGPTFGDFSATRMSNICIECERSRAAVPEVTPHKKKDICSFLS